MKYYHLMNRRWNNRCKIAKYYYLTILHLNNRYRKQWDIITWGFFVKLFDTENSEMLSLDEYLLKHNIIDTENSEILSLDESSLK